MKENWIVVGRYVAVIIASLLLGLALGNMDLFRKTAIAGPKLTASHLVRFLGYGGALVVFWMTLQRLTVILAQQGGRWSSLQHLLLPFGTLIVVSAAYSVLLLVLGPVMDPGMKEVYNWVFVLGTIAAAFWLLIAMFNQSSSVTEMLIGHLTKEERRCAACGTAAKSSDKFCAGCGKPV